MPRYDVRNDGMGPYAAFYCDKCNREYRSQPDVGSTIAKDVGRRVAGDALRNIPLFGRAIADNVVGQDQRYVYDLTPPQLEAAWKQVQPYFHECPTCHQLVCPSCFDSPSGYCAEDSPRRGEIAEAQTQQAAGVVKGLASAFGLGDAIQQVTQAAKTAASSAARCPNDGTLAAPGTKFCPECGAAMVQPATNACPQCGATVAPGAKFCPECGAKIAQAAPANCPNCGADVKGAKFCPECGTKVS
jgi:hypothetical protein